MTHFYVIKHYLNKLMICRRNRWDYRLVFLCDINLNEIPKSTKFCHPYAIIIRGGTKLGKNCCINQNVTIGQRKSESEPTHIGNNVSIGVNVMILGSVIVGDNVVIGAGAIVLNDVPADTTVVGIWK